MSCLCIRPKRKCRHACSTIERWADACRRAHWSEDAALKSWPEFVRDSLGNDGSEAEFWRDVAKAAIDAMNAEVNIGDLGVFHDIGADRERRRIRKAQRDALVVINGFNVPERLWKAAMKQLDAATRAKKGKRK